MTTHSAMLLAVLVVAMPIATGEPGRRRCRVCGSYRVLHRFRVYHKNGRAYRDWTCRVCQAERARQRRRSSS